MLADLKMPGALEAADGILAQADGGSVTAGEAIEKLLDAQIELRNNRRLSSAMRSSCLPAVKTLGEFDFAFQPSIKREQVESLHELGFVERAENVILLGPPGVGKTHLAISLAVAAAESGRRVYYGTLADLVESLMEAKTSGNLAHRLKVLTHPALLGAPKSPNPPPSASFDLHQHGGHGPLTVSVDAGASRDPEGGKLEYDWDFGDRYEAVGVAASHTYGEAGTFTIRLTVTDERGANAATDRSVTVEVEDLVCAPPP